MQQDTTMGASESSEGSGSGYYSKQLYFDSDAGERTYGPTYLIADADLKERMSQLADVNEEILNVTIYKHPLNAWQVIYPDTFLHVQLQWVPLNVITVSHVIF
jgi:hypothetical protein